MLLVTIDPLALTGTPSSSASPLELSFLGLYLAPVLELILLRAFLHKVARLGCMSSMWDVKAVSPFDPVEGDEEGIGAEVNK